MKRLLKTLGIIAALALVYILTVVLYQMRPWVSTESIPADVDSQRESRTFAPKHQPIAQIWDKQLPLWRQQSHAPSLSIAVGHGGELIWAGVIGYKDLAHKIPAQLDTGYRIGSTSKALTATGLATLYDQRQLSLNAPIQDYLPTYPASDKPTTLRQLMSHQAGVRHYQPLWLPPFNEYLLNKPFLTVEEGLLLFKDDPRIATPGDEFHYSSYGINLASAVMEKAANRTFLQLMQQEIFDPLAMTHTYGEKESVPKGTQWYQLHGDGKVSLAAPVNSSYKWASGGFISTPTDLVKLGNSWITLKLFSDETRQLFFTPQTLANGDINPQSYALGWRVEQKKIEQIQNGEIDVRIVHHGGTAQGSSAFLVIFPEHNLVVAATMNGLSENFGVLSNICFSAAGMYLAQAEN